MRKKKKVYVFCNFPATGNEKKKRETKTKMLVQELEMGYCPNCVVTKGLGSWALSAGRRRSRHGAGRRRARHGTQGRGARGRDARGTLHTGLGTT